MVRARYTAEEDRHTLLLNGHANYAEYGRDIVCAGVSALVQALIGWVENHSHTVELVSINEKIGEVAIACSGGEDVSAVFYMTAVGIEQIANTYPDNVEIQIIGIAD